MKFFELKYTGYYILKRKEYNRLVYNIRKEIDSIIENKTIIDLIVLYELSSSCIRVLDESNILVSFYEITFENIRLSNKLFDSINIEVKVRESDSKILSYTIVGE